MFFRYTRFSLSTLLVLMTLLVSFSALPTLRADDAGQADLDAATDARLGAETLSDLEKVAGLCESALKKGLGDENKAYANELLGSVLLQHAQKITSAIFEQTPPDRRWQFIRQVAMKDLERATKVLPTSSDAQLLIVKLQVLPGGDLKVARSAADEAIKLLADDKPQMAKVLVLRGQLRENDEERLADFSAALEADSNSTDALQARSMLLLSKGENEKAIADLMRLLEVDATNLAAQGAVAEALANLEKFDDALKHVDRVIELKPKVSLGYSLRARIRVLQEKLDDAVADLNTALELNPDDVAALLLRGRILAEQNKFDEAKADVEKALALRPDITQAILLRSLISAQAKRYGDAIADIRTLLQADPQNAELRLQLGAYYAADSRPRKAIEIFDQLIESDDSNWQARRSRADALLSVGEHAKAIEDYEVALKAQPEDSHMLNNLAWVLATSTDDTVRNAKRSLEIGKRACEVTNNKAPHILSTLAAGYAEAGEWDEAVKWSSKAVEVSEAGVGKETGREPDVSEQLKKELESYKQKKPWREKQEVEENTKPLDEKKGDLEA